MVTGTVVTIWRVILQARPPWITHPNIIEVTVERAMGIVRCSIAIYTVTMVSRKRRRYVAWLQIEVTGQPIMPTAYELGSVVYVFSRLGLC